MKPDLIFRVNHALALYSINYVMCHASVFSSYSCVKVARVIERAADNHECNCDDLMMI